jgi:flagellar hook-length control protein FliK
LQSEVRIHRAERFIVPSVASQTVHSSHHGHAAQGRPTTPAAKEPETPFAQLLDQLGPPAADNEQGLGANTPPASRSGPSDDGTQAPKTAAPAKSEGQRQDAKGDGSDAKSANDAAGQAATTATDTAAATNGKQAAEIVAKTDADSDSESGSDVDASTASASTDQSPAGADAAAITPATLLTPPQTDSATNSTDASGDASTVAIAAAGGGKKEAKTSTDVLRAAADAPSANDPAASDASPQTADAASKGDATDPSVANAKAQTDRGTTQPMQTQAPDNDDDGSAPATDVAAGTAAPPAPAASDHKSGEVQPSGEPSSGKAEHHLHLADTAPAGDTIPAAADLTVAGADPGQGANPSPADGIQSAPAPTGDQPATTAQTAGAPVMAAAVPIAGLAVEIAARAQTGSNRFEIRLDPPELGRVEVRLDVDKNGHVNSRLVVDRPDTLDLLRRDAGDLQRALQQAGLTTTDDGLQFSLRDQGFAGFGNGDPSNTARLIVPDPDLNPAETAAAGYGRILSSSGGIDIRV